MSKKAAKVFTGQMYSDYRTNEVIHQPQSYLNHKSGSYLYPNPSSLGASSTSHSSSRYHTSTGIDQPQSYLNHQNTSYLYANPSSLDTSSTPHSPISYHSNNGMSQSIVNSDPRMASYGSPYSNSDKGLEHSHYNDHLGINSQSCSSTYDPSDYTKQYEYNQSHFTSHSDYYNPTIESLSTAQHTDGMNSNWIANESSHLQGSQECFEFDTLAYMNTFDDPTSSFLDNDIDRLPAEINFEDDHSNSLNITEDVMSNYMADIHSDGGLPIDFNLGIPEVYNPSMSDYATNVERKRCVRKESKSLIQEIPISKECVDEMVEKTQGVGNRERGPKSWEFLMRLLMNKVTNPLLIRWENESDFTFKLVKPAVIAQMWAFKSESSSNSKDNFARSLRFHYKKGVLIPVREKQFTYKCGPKAVAFINKQMQRQGIF